MSTTAFKGNTVNTFGSLPAKDTKVPDFLLTGTNLAEVSLKDYSGKRLIFNIFPSLDTSVCAASVRRFNVEAAKLPDTAVLCISKDLPFAHSRFCTTEGINNVVNLSEYKSNSFGKTFGVMMTDGPLQGLMARSVIVTDADHKVLYTELVDEITSEPDYEAAVAVLK